MMEAGALRRMTEITVSRRAEGETVGLWKKRVNFSTALLANMTRTERGAVELVGRTMPDEAVVAKRSSDDVPLPTKPTLELLLARFLSSEFVDEVDGDYNDQEALDNMAELDSRHCDPYQHFAAVLMNSTQVEAGRRFVLRIQLNGGTATSVLQAILPQLRANNPIRRRGIAGTVKNCCLDKDSAWWFLEEVKIVKHLLYPLAGPEELDVDEKRGLDPDLWLQGPDKQREPDHLTRLFLVESILLLLASGRRSRERLRLERVYVILRLADMVEEHEDVSERISECVQFLRRDEEGMEEGSSDKLVEESFKRSRQALPTSSTANLVESNENYDDVD
jgi:hypothetical protein